MKMSISAVTLFACLLVPQQVVGISSVDQCAYAGTPIDAEMVRFHGWPAGVRDLLNSPLRGDGWHPWFSECQNDWNYFEFDVTSAADVQHVLRLLEAVEAETVRVFLAPGAPRPHSALAPQSSAAPVVFSIGSQVVIDRWYNNLSRGANGARVWGVHRFTRPPSAAPPTLTLYVGSDAIDLSTLSIPDRFEIAEEISESDAAHAPYAADIAAIRRYIADPYPQQRRREQLRRIVVATVAITAGVLALLLAARLSRRRKASRVESR